MTSEKKKVSIPRQSYVLRVNADFFGVLDLHSDVDVGVFSVADLDDGQTGIKVGILRLSNRADFRFDGITNVLRRHVAVQQLRAGMARRRSDHFRL